MKEVGRDTAPVLRFDKQRPQLGTVRVLRYHLPEANHRLCFCASNHESGCLQAEGVHPTHNPSNTDETAAVFACGQMQ